MRATKGGEGPRLSPPSGFRAANCENDSETAVQSAAVSGYAAEWKTPSECVLACNPRGIRCSAMPKTRANSRRSPRPHRAIPTARVIPSFNLTRDKAGTSDRAYPRCCPALLVRTRLHLTGARVVAAACMSADGRPLNTYRPGPGAREKNLAVCAWVPRLHSPMCWRRTRCAAFIVLVNVTMLLI